MVWSNPPVQYEITLPSDADLGQPGSVYIGGPNLPSELAPIVEFAIVWYPLPNPLFKYFFYAFNTVARTWWEGAYSLTLSSLVVYRSLSPQTFQIPYDNGQPILDVHGSNTLGSFEVGTRAQNMSRMLWTGVANFPTYTGDRQTVVDNLGRIARVRESVDGSSANPTVTQTLETELVNVPQIISTWFADTTKSYLTDNTVLDTWQSISDSGTLGGIAWTFSGDVKVTYDRIVELRGLVAFASAPTTLTMSTAAVIPAIARPIASPGGFSGIWITIAAQIGAGATNRTMIAGAVNAGGQLLLRGGSSNPSGFTHFNVNGMWTVNKL